MRFTDAGIASNCKRKGGTPQSTPATTLPPAFPGRHPDERAFPLLRFERIPTHGHTGPAYGRPAARLATGAPVRTARRLQSCARRTRIHAVTTATTTYNAVLVWFRRDLRDFDHAALHHALESARAVYAAFVFDREILDALPSPRGPPGRVHLG